jgi:hypothetical protein
MPQAEPQQHVKSDGTAGPMSIEIDLDTKVTTEPVVGEAPDRTVEAPPKALDLPPPAGTPERPAWLDPRFQTPEALAEAYKALESKIGAPKAPEAPAPAKAPEAPPPVPAGLTDAELLAYGQEVIASGQLSAASYAALAAKGIPRALADAHVEGINLKREKLMADAVKPFGGAEGYAEAAKWAVENLSVAEQAQYNADVRSGDPARVQYAVNGLKARVDAAQVRQPALVHGRRAGAVTGGGFQTMEQQVAAMMDPRYNNDPAYTQEVVRMVRESTY